MSFVEALNNATEDDLKQIQDQITEMERTLQSLKQARTILQKKLGRKVNPTRSEKSNRARDEGRDEFRNEMHDFIGENGPTSVKKLCDVIEGATPRRIAATVRESDWFERDGEMISNATA